MTTQIFLYGTLCHLPLLQVVLGRDPIVVRATLLEHGVVWAKDQSFPVLRPEPGGRAQGILISATDADRARLDFYEGPFGYGLQGMRVDTATGPVEAQVYVPKPGMWEPGPRWSLPDWQAQWGALQTRTATEIMAAFGLQSPHDIAARDGIIKSRAQAYLSTNSWVRPRRIGRPLGADQVQITEHVHEHLGFFRLDQMGFSHPRFEGGPPLEVSRTVFHAGEAVTVLPYDPVRDRVLLVEQFRAAPMAMGDPDPWLLEPVAGIRDTGEDPETTARREAVEEAGTDLRDLHLVARYYPSPGGVAQVLWSYVGLCDLPDDAQSLGGLAEEGEDIAIHLLPRSEAMAALARGEIVVAPLILSLQWLETHHHTLGA